MKADPSHLWNSVELHEHYSSFGGVNLSRRALIIKLEEFFGDELLVLSGKGVANLVVFRQMASELLRLPIIDDDDEVLVDTVGSQIEQEIKDLPVNKNTYKTRVNLDIVSNECSNTLLSLLSRLSKKPCSYLPNVLVANMITCLVTNHPTSLQIALAVLLRDKHLIHTFNKYGVTCSYDETIRFRGSAAVAASQD